MQGYHNSPCRQHTEWIQEVAAVLWESSTEYKLCALQDSDTCWTDRGSAVCLCLALRSSHLLLERWADSGRVLQALASTHCLPRVSVRLGREAKEYKKDIALSPLGDLRTQTSCLWEPSNSENIRETLQRHVLQPLTHLGQGWVQWFCPLSYRQ